MRVPSMKGAPEVEPKKIVLTKLSRRTKILAYGLSIYLVNMCDEI